MDKDKIKKEAGWRSWQGPTCALVAGPLVIVLLVGISLTYKGHKFGKSLVSVTAHELKPMRCEGVAWQEDERCFSTCTKAASETVLTTNVSWQGVSCQKCRGWTGEDPIFRYMEKLHGANVPWGAVLDAGTGPVSYEWLVSLPGKTRCDAVTASPSMARVASSRARQRSAGSRCTIHVHKWMAKESFLNGQLYDNIIMDYFIGAVEGFEAYTQERLFKKLRRHLAPQGRLWIVGLEPFPHRDILPAHVHSGMVAVAELRDTAIALSGERPYREFPLHWYEAAVESAGLKRITSAGFANVYGFQWVVRQLHDAHTHLQKCKHAAVCEGLHRDVVSLQARLEREWGSTDRCFGMDFVVVAGPSGV